MPLSEHGVNGEPREASELQTKYRVLDRARNIAHIKELMERYNITTQELSTAVIESDREKLRKNREKRNNPNVEREQPGRGRQQERIERLNTVASIAQGRNAAIRTDGNVSVARVRRPDEEASGKGTKPSDNEGEIGVTNQQRGDKPSTVPLEANASAKHLMSE